MNAPFLARLAALPLLGLAFSTLAADPLVVVHKHASCGCCNGWVSHLRKAGFEVEVRNVEHMTPVKERVGVPSGKQSCHTAEVGGYFIEGHVPAVDVKRLLADTNLSRRDFLPSVRASRPSNRTRRLGL